eukprot:c6219_g1_i1.p3 GENE.c6219_g1_i1~~c6219_g1_i1.p3  ORF type:complete len:128 (-),score=30.50 c6219_g1_i1:797-1180(-)
MSLFRSSLFARTTQGLRVGIQTTRVHTPASFILMTRGLGAAASSFLPRDSVTERVLSVVKGFDRVEAGKVSPTSRFQQDLGLDSLDTVELLMAVEEEFAIEIPDADAEKILSTEEAINYICSHPNAK